MLRIFTRKEVFCLLFVTLGIMLINYVAYYADEFIYFSQDVPHDTLVTIALKFISFPVHFYIEVFEKKYFLDIPILGRAVNYAIEIAYFFFLTVIAYLKARNIYRLIRYFRNWTPS